MKGFKHILLIVLLILCPVRTTGASETARTFLDGIKDYKEDRFAEAAAAFSKIADEGIINGKLFYNLGNAYLKNGDIGNAMLWYERALKLLPHDPDLKFNYEYAQSLTKDEKGDKDLPLFRILFFWKYLLSQTQIQWTAIIFNLIFWSLMAARVIRRKNRFQTISHVILALGLIFTFTAVYNDYEANFIKEAVILPARVSIRSGLTDDATELFVLHAGAKVKIDKEKDDYIRISYSEGKIGWIKKTDAGVIFIN
jgi:tetratricopeptide (TPR) repeat protein